jgi:hypothetical protein
MQALAQQQQQMQFMQHPMQKSATLFVGSISGGITDAFLNELLGVCFMLLTILTRLEIY